MTISRRNFEAWFCNCETQQEALLLIALLPEDGIMRSDNVIVSRETLLIIAMGVFEGKINPNFATSRLGFRKKLIALASRPYDRKYSLRDDELVIAGLKLKYLPRESRFIII